MSALFGNYGKRRAQIVKGQGTVVEDSTGKQYLEDGTSTRDYILSAAMLNYRYKKISVVLNCENLFNFKEGNYGQLVYPPYSNPVFSDIWGPLEGRVFNLSLQVKW